MLTGTSALKRAVAHNVPVVPDFVLLVTTNTPLTVPPAPLMLNVAGEALVILKKEIMALHNKKEADHRINQESYWIFKK